MLVFFYYGLVKYAVHSYWCYMEPLSTVGLASFDHDLRDTRVLAHSLPHLTVPRLHIPPDRPGAHLCADVRRCSQVGVLQW